MWRLLFLLFCMSCVEVKSTADIKDNEKKSKTPDELRALLPRMSHSFEYASYLLGEASYLKSCDYLGEYNGKKYFEATFYRFNKHYNKLYIVYEIYTNHEFPDALCAPSTGASHFFLGSTYDLEILNDYDGLLTLKTTHLDSQVRYSDPGVLSVLNDSSFNNGARLCDIDWTSATINTDYDVTDAPNCKIDVKHSGTLYNFAYLDSNYSLRLGKHSLEFDGSSLEKLPTALDSPVKLYAIDWYWSGINHLPIGEISLFMHQLSWWLGDGYSCMTGELTYQNYYHWDNYPNGTYREVYYTCGEFTAPLFTIDYDVTMTLEDRISTEPLAYNMYLNVKSAKMDNITTTGANKINQDGFCDLGGITSGQKIDVLNRPSCSVNSNEIIYSQIQFGVNGSAYLGVFDEGNGRLGKSSSDRLLIHANYNFGQFYTGF